MPDYHKHAETVRSPNVGVNAATSAQAFRSRLPGGVPPLPGGDGNRSTAEVVDGSTPPLAEPKELGRKFLGIPLYFNRLLLLAVAYSGVIFGADWLAYLMRFEFHPPVEQQTLFWQTLQWSLPLGLASLFAFGQFRSMLSYFSLPDARRVVLACLATGLVSLAVWYATKGRHAPPRSIIILGFLFATMGVVTVRIGFRMLRERQGSSRALGEARLIVIIGAGDVGANLAKEMKLRRDLGMQPVAFLDDDPGKWNRQIHGVPVLGRPELLAEGKIRADEAVIAMPSASGKRVREVVQIFNEARIRFEIVPSMEQIINGAVKVSQIRPVQIEDLLGRDPISLETQRIAELVRGKVVMVTGAGGSIGSELCRQIAGYHPLRLVLVERCEVQMFPIEQELLGLRCEAQVVSLVADILDGERMRAVFERFRPQVIFHAAAHKHVPMMEHQPYEAFRNNTIGTKNLAKLAARFAVERFILISTDKAINPTNVMGATKRLAELYIQALQEKIRSEERRKEVGAPENATAPGAAQAAEPTVPATTTLTKFMAVRFGNVLGSSGSVIPTFKRQIAAGGPVTVTHPEVTRYFMTIPEAVGLVLQSATLGQGGEIFVLDMGKRVKIVDVARQLIELSGLKPEIDIEIKFIGLRPGEKLFEEFNHKTENMAPTEHPKIMRFVGTPIPIEALRVGLVNVDDRAASMDPDQVKLEIQKLVPEYEPYLMAT